MKHPVSLRVGAATVAVAILLVIVAMGGGTFVLKTLVSPFICVAAFALISLPTYLVTRSLKTGESEVETSTEPSEQQHS